MSRKLIRIQNSKRIFPTISNFNKEPIMKRFIISFFAAAALVGCAKGLTPDQSADQVVVKPGPLVELSTTFADATQSRVALDHQTGKLSWSEGD